MHTLLTFDPAVTLEALVDLLAGTTGQTLTPAVSMRQSPRKRRPVILSECEEPYAKRMSRLAPVA